MSDALPRSDKPGNNAYRRMFTRPVLLVEDHPDTREMVQQFLGFHGIPVVSADNGLTGLVALCQHRPCLVLLDLTMPVMDGWAFRAEQRKLADDALAGTPVVVLSALQDARRHAETLGAAGLIQKPIDFDRLVEVIKSFYPLPEA